MLFIFLYVRLFVCVAFLLVDCGSVSGFMFDCMCFCCFQRTKYIKKAKGSPNSITERRVPELTPVLGSQPAGDVSHKSGGRLPLLSARPTVTPATLKRAATNFAAW